MPEISDQHLVSEFLKLLEPYTGSTIASMVPGVTESDVSRWRSGKWTRLSSAKRDALRGWLEASAEGEIPSGSIIAPPKVAAPDYKSLNFDFPGRELLVEHAARIFDSFIVGLVSKGFTKDEIEHLGRIALAPIVEVDKIPGHRDRPRRELAIVQARFLEAVIGVLEYGLTPPGTPPGEVDNLPDHPRRSTGEETATPTVARS